MRQPKQTPQHRTLSASVTSVVLLAAWTLCFASSSSLEAQVKIGVALGGASTVALLVEKRWEHHGLEAQLGTWGFRDISISVTGKQYVGSAAVEPFVGLGLWGLFAFSEEGRGAGLVARAPVGLDWNFSGAHTATATVYLNRALALKRPDPEDKRPPRTAIIPLPEFSYRWTLPSTRED